MLCAVVDERARRHDAEVGNIAALLGIHRTTAQRALMELLRHVDGEGRRRPLVKVAALSSRVGSGRRVGWRPTSAGVAAAATRQGLAQDAGPLHGPRGAP